MMVRSVKNFPEFHKSRRSVTLFTGTRQWSLSWPRRVPWRASHPIYKK